MALQQLAYLGACAMRELEHKICPEQFYALRRNPDFAIHEVFFAVAGPPLAAAEEALLRQLLAAPAVFCSDSEDRIATGEQASALIIPHPGMVSPWASKAQNIFSHCGLAAVRRIERGILLRCGHAAAAALADPMTQRVLSAPNLGGWRQLFATHAPAPLATFAPALESLRRLNQEHGLALSETELAHLSDMYGRMRRPPTDAELFMFAQANSEHCRHKIFNAVWEDDSESLMQSIRSTHAGNPEGVITAFADNAAVIHAAAGEDFAPNAEGLYRRGSGGLLLVAKAETHNHPTAISPFPGAATGSGGEIRDEAAAGRGAVTRAGFAGFVVSHLGLAKQGGGAHAGAARLASPLRIMTEGPLGAANYCNEFGRPSLAGFFRSYEGVSGGRFLGFHKPLMLAGGLGHMLPASIGKKPLAPGTKIVQLGGPGFRIGIGGGAASSRADGGDDFASVQRDNAEMQRRAQEVIDTCRRLPEGGPILSLHDVGAGGLANAVIELVHDAGRGARIELESIPVEDGSLSPAEICCNEAQERYVLALPVATVSDFAAVCARENCPFAVIGEATEERRVVVTAADGQTVVDLPLAEVLGGITTPPLRATVAAAASVALVLPPPPQVAAACYAVLRHPTVACKRFLITIGDRTVGGLTARDQMVGPWQVPVADCAAFFNDYQVNSGAVFALGERAALAALDPAAGVRIAIAEALSNMAGAGVGDLRRVKLSLNWLGNCSDAVRKGELRCAVRAAADFCRQLAVGVVVGKDSLFMRAVNDEHNTVESPAMVVATAFAPHADVRQILTPQLSGRTDTFLMLAAPADRRRLGGSIFSQIFGEGQPSPDIDAAAMAALWRAINKCRQRGLLLAYHDCADGGLWASACEMAFAANCGCMLTLDALFPATDTDGGDAEKDLAAAGARQQTLAALFSEEIGALLEVRESDAPEVLRVFAEAGLPRQLQTIGRPQASRRVQIYRGGRKLLDESTGDLHRAWEEVSYEIARRRDNAACAEAEYRRDYEHDRGLFARADFTWKQAVGKRRPQVAILREQGSNGQREMAAAFDCAGFAAVDVTMADLRGGRRRLDDSFAGVALCGGFSYGDVLGAGRGWAAAILQNPQLADMFAAFFARADTFAFGACNGCQTLAQLHSLMADAGSWRFPDFLQNRSCRFEARLVMAEIISSPSPLFDGMHGAMLPVVSSNAEGRVCFDKAAAVAQAPPVMRFVDSHGTPTVQYPHNPAGGAGGECGFCSPDGRITLTMLHPERSFRCGQLSWYPPDWRDEHSPWLRMFINARRMVQ